MKQNAHSLPCPAAVFTDGGIIGKPGQSLQGVYAFAWASTPSLVIPGPEPPSHEYLIGTEYVKRHYIAHEAGVIELEPDFVAEGFTQVTSNLAELIAILRALRSLPAGWSGPLYSDSQNALGRVFWNWNTCRVPDKIKRYIPVAKARLGKVEGIHVDGHPTVAQLRKCSGHGGKPVSKFNELCDDSCNLVKATGLPFSLAHRPELILPHVYPKPRKPIL